MVVLVLGYALFPTILKCQFYKLELKNLELSHLNMAWRRLSRELGTADSIQIILTWQLMHIFSGASWQI